MKIAIFHDNLLQIGGSEKSVIILANKLKLDIITSGYNPEIKNYLDIKTKVIDLGNITHRYSKTFSYMVESPLRYLLTKKSKEYDLIIFSGQSSFFAARNNKINIWFCHTPNRTLYDLKDYKSNSFQGLKKLFLLIYLFLMKPLDQYFIKEKINKIVVNSKNTKRRVKRYYELESTIINPPVETKKFFNKKSKDYYLLVSRLTKEKRVDLVVNAFNELIEEKLIIVGDGPEKAKIKDMIKDNKNITLVEDIKDKKLRLLYSSCKATIYMPINEDFGLVPIESMASGKPCIAANEGGCKETITNEKTGYLIKADKKAIIKKIRELSGKDLKNMNMNCINRSKIFDIENIINKWRSLIEKYE
jgi:glycosyltransferase involved in cell wall biosynthesis